MDEMYQMLSQVDDDYLIGLSNKGIVKRAYKDLENAALSIENEAEAASGAAKELTVFVDDVTCRLTLPIGESTCTCPSRSMCKHIVMAVIFAKEKFAGQAADKSEAAEVAEGIVKAADGNAEAADGTDEAAGETEKTADGKTKTTDGNDEAAEENAKATDETVKTTDGTSQRNKRTADFTALLEYPLSAIKKQLGISKLRTIYEHIAMENKASIEESSIVTVSLADEGMTVKLLVPPEYSTCSCHKKELCVHKGEAIIRYQLLKEKITADHIADIIAGEEEQGFDREAVSLLADKITDMLGEIISTGLARISPEHMDSCERFAIMCHNLRLAESEKKFRGLSEQFKLYFNRHASFRVERLLRDIAYIYGDMARISNMDGKALTEVAGKLRTEYTASKPLNLIGMGYRYFKSEAGYEGITVYFIEEHTGRFYTYTSARPMYYENKRTKKMTEKEGAPWGLPFSLEQLAQSRIHLSKCKVNDEGRLSSSQETVAEYIGVRTFDAEGIRKNSFYDFARMFQKKFFPDWEKYAEERLVLVYPEVIEDAFFDNIRQQFFMLLKDGNGKYLKVRIAYSAEESYNIKYLERIYKQISDGKRKPACFLGSVYINDGELMLYPIEYYGDITGDETRDKVRDKTEEKTAGKDIGDGKKDMDSMSYRGIREQLDNCGNLMTHVFQSGMQAVSGQTINDIKQSAVTAMQYGMEKLSHMLKDLSSVMEDMKHSTGFSDYKELVSVFVSVNIYVAEALSKVKYDEIAGGIMEISDEAALRA